MRAVRLGREPIIHPGMHPSLGNNINGASLIRVPSWIPQPLGRYYLYFAHHQGTHLRLAYANHLEGPWTIHPPGVLPLASSGLHDHVASPDVHVDAEARQIRLYLHGVAFAPGSPTDGHEHRFGAASRWINDQRTRVALSADGLHFDVLPENLGASYWRAFEWQGWVYALAMPGMFYRSRDGLRHFESGPLRFDASFRHAAVLRRGSQLHILYTRVGDCPEHIRHCRLDLEPPWHEWQPQPSAPLLLPELAYEGADAPSLPSRRGPVYEHVRQLRDPAIFQEDGETFLLYSVAGEQGIALARLELT